MIALRPRDQHVWDPRPVPHETETETKTKKVVSRPSWSRDLNIPAFGAFCAEKIAAVGAVSVQYQRMKPKRFGEENYCKTEADFYVSLAPT